MTFGEKIKQERLKRGMDQKHFAALIGVSFRTVQNYETKNVLPRTRDAYRKIAAALGVNVNYLLSDDEEFLLTAKEQFGARGKRDAEQLMQDAGALFAGGVSSEHMPTTALTAEDLTDGGIGVLTLMVKCGLAASNGEARRLITQGGVTLNGEKLTDPKQILTAEAIRAGETILKKGKKIFHKVTVE